MASFLTHGLLWLSVVSPVVDLQAQATSAPSFPSNEQLRHFKAMSDPRLAADGKRILIRVTEATADGGKSHIWLTGMTGEDPRQLTYSPDADKRGEYDGEWMPDGQSILFLAKRDAHVSLYRLPMTGGEAKAFSLKIKPMVDQAKLADALPLKDDAGKTENQSKPEEIDIDVTGYKVSPDGNSIAIVARDPETAGEKAQKEAKADADWVNHNPHGARLYLLNVATGKLIPLPVPPDVHEAHWSSDSQKLLAISEGTNGAGDLAPAMSSWLVTLADASHPQPLADLPPTVTTAAWIPARNSILYLAQATHDAPPSYVDLYSYDLGTRATHNLSADGKGSLRDEEPIALADGTAIQLVQLGFNGKVAHYTPGTPEPELVVLPPSHVSDVNTNAQRNGWVLLGSGGGNAPQLYYTAELKTAPVLVKTPSLTPEQMLSVAPKPVQWKSDGFTIEGRLYLPPEAATRHVPLIVEVHGGPLGAYSDAHEPWVDFLLGHGWAVLRTNPRGSSGYGAPFAAANKNDLGGGDYRDIMSGVDYVVKTEPIDSHRMALMGYSYGGEMAAFMEGKTTRFQAIISGAPVIDQHSEYGTEESSWYDRWYFGKPWEHPDDAWRQSPLAAAGKARTPFLLLQGEDDTTDPLGQSREMYRALRQAGVAVELVTYPRDNHVPLALAIYGYPVPEPWHGYDARRRIVAFLQKAFDAVQ